MMKEHTSLNLVWIVLVAAVSWILPTTHMVIVMQVLFTILAGMAIGELGYRVKQKLTKKEVVGLK